PTPSVNTRTPARAARCAASRTASSSSISSPSLTSTTARSPPLSTRPRARSVACPSAPPRAPPPWLTTCGSRASRCRASAPCTLETVGCDVRRKHRLGDVHREHDVRGARFRDLVARAPPRPERREAERGSGGHDEQHATPGERRESAPAETLEQRQLAERLRNAPPASRIQKHECRGSERQQNGEPEQIGAIETHGSLPYRLARSPHSPMSRMPASSTNGR